MRNLAFFISVIGLGLFPSCAPAGTPATKNLDAVQANIETDFKTVAQLTAKEVLALDPKQTLILDIREPEEYAVSRPSPAQSGLIPNPTRKAPLSKLAMSEIKTLSFIVRSASAPQSSQNARKTNCAKWEPPQSPI